MYKMVPYGASTHCPQTGITNPIACMDLRRANQDQCHFRSLSPSTILVLDYTPWISLGQQPHSSSRNRIRVAEPWTPYSNASSV